MRDRQTGVWWQHDQLERLGEQHMVTVVRRRRELEGLALPAMDSEVSGWVGSEGVVVRMDNGVVLKMKSWWWRQCEKKEKRRWYALGNKLQAIRREAKRREHMERNHWVIG